MGAAIFRRLGILLRLLDLLAGELAGRHRVLALDALGDILVGDAFHFQGMQAAEIGDLLEGQRGIVHQPDGGGLGHQGFRSTAIRSSPFPGGAFPGPAPRQVNPFEEGGSFSAGSASQGKGFCSD